jgi:hypothetical protein
MAVPRESNLLSHCFIIRHIFSSPSSIERHFLNGIQKKTIYLLSSP